MAYSRAINAGPARRFWDRQCHRDAAPAILYFGTPVVLVSTENPDGTTNLAPISSAWWLGQRCVLGLDASSQTTINLVRTGQCVLNLPSDDMADAVNPLAKTTGASQLPPHKAAWGYAYVKDKFAAAGLEQQASDLVRPTRAKQCPVQMEAEMVGSMELMKDVRGIEGAVVAFELKILKVHAMEYICSTTHANRIDPDKWRPLIMSFQRFYGVTSELAPSRLAQINEDNYRILSNDPVPAAEEPVPAVTDSPCPSKKTRTEPHKKPSSTKTRSLKRKVLA